jgi:hypothetical protein
LSRFGVWLSGFNKIVIFVHLRAIETRYGSDLFPGSRSERSIGLVPFVEQELPGLNGESVSVQMYFVPLLLNLAINPPVFAKGLSGYAAPLVHPFLFAVAAVSCHLLLLLLLWAANLSAVVEVSALSITSPIIDLPTVTTVTVSPLVSLGPISTVPLLSTTYIHSNKETYGNRDGWRHGDIVFLLLGRNPSSIRWPLDAQHALGLLPIGVFAENLLKAFRRIEKEVVRPSQVVIPVCLLKKEPRFLIEGHV